MRVQLHECTSFKLERETVKRRTATRVKGSYIYFSLYNIVIALLLLIASCIFVILYIFWFWDIARVAVHSNIVLWWQYALRVKNLSNAIHMATPIFLIAVLLCGCVCVCLFVCFVLLFVELQRGHNLIIIFITDNFFWQFHAVSACNLVLSISGCVRIRSLRSLVSCNQRFWPVLNRKWF